MVADRRDERGYSGDSNLVELKTNHTYLVHSEAAADQPPTYILATVKEIYSTPTEFEDASPKHITYMSAAWKAWGNREKKKEEVQAIIDTEQKSVDDLKEFWREKYVGSDSMERRFCVARIVWFERRSIEARKGRDAVNISFWGPWYPHHITGKYIYEGLVANDAFVAMVNTTSAGYFRQISRSEQVKLKSLPTRGQLLKSAAIMFDKEMQDLANHSQNHPTAPLYTQKVKKETKISEEIDVDAPLGPIPPLSEPISERKTVEPLFSKTPPSARRMTTRTRKVTRKKEVVADIEHDSVDAMSTESEPYVSSDDSSGKLIIGNHTNASVYTNSYLPFKIHQLRSWKAAK